VGHCELQIGDSVLMLADELPEMGPPSPKTLGGPLVTLMVYVEHVDKTFGQALAAGATETAEVKDQFYGDRSGQFLDPSGHRWRWRPTPRTCRRSR